MIIAEMGWPEAFALSVGSIAAAFAFWAFIKYVM